MSALIEKLFNKSQTTAIQKLWDDADSRGAIEEAIAQRILNSDEIIEESPLAQIMFLMTLSPFASNVSECHDVAEIIIWGLKKDNVLPSIVEHRKEDLAYRCLISLCLFKDALTYKCNRHGAPKPEFYRQVGISTFHQLGKNDISLHFRQWEAFIPEILI